jgi:pantoate--beta-alanine ligase
MGALHEGHTSLIEKAREHGARFVAVTIFVNPLQFGPNEDYERYPRTLEPDLEKCRAHGVDVVLAPARDAMYPAGFSTRVEVDGLTEHLEGAHRPGHFDGVTTVVAKLFALAAPCVAVFGQKDYQQWKIVERLARDLDLRVTVVGAPIVREPDGLALSSRNRYLSADERTRALAISRGLGAARAAFETGERSAEALRALAARPVEEAFDSVDYVALADPETLEAIDGVVAGRALVAVAARIGKTRLIDNTVLGQVGSGR